MEDKLNVKGLIFDFGGTLDTGGNHWGEVLWEVYRHFGVPVMPFARHISTANGRWPCIR